MYDTVSVDDAIDRGDRMVKYPVMTMLFVPTLISVLLALVHFIPAWVILVALLVSFIIAWLIYCFMVTRWRIWALEHVRNVHELRMSAIPGMLWPENSFFGKWEWHTQAYSEKWLVLQSKFDQPDVFQDDLRIPAETIIYYAKANSYVLLSIMLIPLVFGIYLWMNDSRIIGGIMMLGVAYRLFREYKQAKNKDPQIIINNEGIQTISTPFFPWKHIYDEKIVIQRAARNIRTYLQYEYPQGVASLKIDDYGTDRRRLARLLKVYRGRSKSSI